jgi:hypothetical protein
MSPTPIFTVLVKPYLKLYDPSPTPHLDRCSFDTLIAQIKASEIFMLRHLNHPFSSSLAEI